MSQILSDNFTRANANPIAGIYSTMASHSGCQLLSNSAQPAALSVNCVSVDTTNSYPNDQWCAITMGLLTPGTGVLMSPCLRCNAAADSFNSVAIQEGNTSVGLFWRTNASTSGTIGTWTLPRGPIQGDTFYLQVQGQVFTLVMNGTPVGSPLTDSGAHVTAGSVGFSMEGFAGNQVGITLLTAGSFTIVEAANDDAFGGGFQAMSGGFA